MGTQRGTALTSMDYAEGQIWNAHVVLRRSISRPQQPLDINL
jgi:hypothetical protein